MPRPSSSRSLLPLALAAALLACRTSPPRPALPPGAWPSAPRIVQELELCAPPAEEARVVLHAQGLAPEQRTLRLELPEAVGFARLPDPLFVGQPSARAGDGRALALARPTPFVLEVATEGERELEVRWSVALTHRSAPEVVAANDAFEFPYVAADHALLVAGSVLARATNLPGAEELVRVRAPDGWRVLAPWPEREPGLYAPGEGLANDLLALGAWEERALAFDGHWGRLELTVAVAPGQPGLLELVGEPIERLVRAELELFGRTPFTRYLVLFGRCDFNGFGGSPKHASMTLVVGGELRDVAERFVPHLVAHEFFHTFATHAELPDAMRWLHEGVTDWYAHAMSARVGLASAEQLAEAVAEKLDALERNGGWGSRSLVEAGGPGFFEGGDDYRLVYEGGLVVGAWLELALRARGASLDALLREFLAPERLAAGGSAGLDGFLALLAEHGGERLALQLEALVRKPFAPDAPALFAAAGAKLARELVPPSLELRANLEGTTFGAIDPADVAWRLGLRPGDRVLELNGREPTDERALRAAWGAPQAGRVRARYLRDGLELTLDAPLEPAARYTLDPAPWLPRE